jgi:hypothetical protein
MGDIPLPIQGRAGLHVERRISSRHGDTLRAT